MPGRPWGWEASTLLGSLLPRFKTVTCHPQGVGGNNDPMLYYFLKNLLLFSVCLSARSQ